MTLHRDYRLLVPSRRSGTLIIHLTFIKRVQRVASLSLVQAPNTLVTLNVFRRPENVAATSVND